MKQVCTLVQCAISKALAPLPASRAAAARGSGRPIRPMKRAQKPWAWRMGSRGGGGVGGANEADEAGPEALGLANAQQGRQGPWGRWLAAHHNPVLMNFIA